MPVGVTAGGDRTNLHDMHSTPVDAAQNAVDPATHAIKKCT